MYEDGIAAPSDESMEALERVCEAAKEMYEALKKMVEAISGAIEDFTEYVKEAIEEAIDYYDDKDYDHFPRTIECNSTEICAPTVVRRPIPP